MATPAPVTPMFALKPQADYMYRTDLMRNRPAGAPLFPGLFGEDLEPTIDLPKSTRTPKQQPAPTYHQMPDRTAEAEAPSGLSSLGISPETVKEHTERVHSVKQQEIGVPSGLSSLGISVETIRQHQERKGSQQTGGDDPGLLRQGLDVLGGTAEVANQLVMGSVGWPLGVGAYLQSQMQQRVGDALGILPDTTDAEKHEKALAKQEKFQTFGGLLQAPSTQSGQAAMRPINWALEKVTEGAEWFVPESVDPEKYPGLHHLLKLGAEGALMSIVGHAGVKGGKAAKQSKIVRTIDGKLQRLAEARKAKQQAKADSIAKGAEAYIQKNAPDIVEVFNPERQALVKNEFDLRRQAIKDSDLSAKEKKKQLNKLENEWKQKNQEMLESMAKAKEAQRAAAEQTGTRDRIAEAAARRQQQMAGTEGMSAFDIPRRPEPPGATPSDLSQRTRGFDSGEVRRPTFEPEPRRRAEGPVETQRLGGTPELQTGETIPRSSYQIGPDGKVQKVSEVGARKTYQINEFGKPELVENVPGERQVWKIKPKEDGGSSSTLYSGIPIDFSYAKKLFGKALDKVPIDKIYRNKKLWKETGIWAARDGSWRYEIPFDKAEIRPKAAEALVTGSPVKLPILIKHKELFDAVPQLKDVTVKIDPYLEAVGNYDHTTNTITIKHLPNKLNFVHEIQHGINDFLDTFKGSNDITVFHNNVFMRLNEAIKNATQQGYLDIATVINRIYDKIPYSDVSKFADSFSKQIDAIKKAFEAESMQVGDSDIAVDYLYKIGMLDHIKEVIQNTAKQSFDDYRKLPGEMEARLFQRRTVMTPEQRAKEAPWETLDKMLTDEGYGAEAGTTLYSGLDISRIFGALKPSNLKRLAKSMTAEQLETVRTLGMQAERAGEPLYEHLKKNGMPNEQARKLSKVYDAVRNDRPWFGGRHFAKIPEGVRDPIRLVRGERNVNTSKKANQFVPVGEEILYQAMSAKKPTGGLGRLGKAFTPTPWMLEKFGDTPFLKDLWHKSHAIERAVQEANQAVFAKAKELQKIYPDRKLREEAYIKMMSQEKLGRKSLIDDGFRPIDGPIQYEGLVLELNKVFEDFFNQVNHTRTSLGLKPIRQVQHYLPMIAREHFLDRARKIFDGEGGAKDGTPNLVLDSPEMIRHRHTPNAMSATKFAHKKRWHLKDGVHLETDPIKLMTRYGQTANKHIHYSPLNAFVKELTSNPLHDPIKGRVWRMKDHNYPMHEFLTRWSNKLAGKPNVILPDAMKFVETGARTLNRNLTLSTLGYSLRTVVIQPTALAYTMAESGVGRTMKAALDHAMFRDNVPIEKSDFIANRTMDANIPALTEYILASPTGKVMQFPAKYAMEALKFVDAQAAKIAWRAAYKQYEHLGEPMAIRMADRTVARTHGSGFTGDLSPVQMNALGKSLTLWQTFTINQLNWLAKDVLNLKHPERNPAQTVQKIFTYVVATELLGHLFEEGIGIEAPMPAPGHAILESMKNNETGWETSLNLLFEMSEFVPMLSSGKFGSHWLGAPIDFIGKTSQTVQKDLEIVLDPSATEHAKDSARIRILTLLGRGFGVPGTGQVSKYVKARRRGETGFHAVMGRYDEDSKGGRPVKGGMKYTPAY